jgi:hypothetical protein
MSSPDSDIKVAVASEAASCAPRSSATEASISKRAGSKRPVASARRASVAARSNSTVAARCSLAR